MIVYINTSDTEQLHVAVLDIENVVIEKTVAAKFAQEENLLSTIDAIFAAANISHDMIVGIAVVVGPGTFSALRIGITCANALAYTWQVPIVGVQKDTALRSIAEKLQQNGKQQVIQPLYNAEPNIGTA